MALAASILAAQKPDVALFQEFWLSENPTLAAPYSMFLAQSFDKRGSPTGTTIHSVLPIERTMVVLSPHEEILIGVKKATAIGTVDGVQFASMHGYNGWPRKDVEYLIDHVGAVLSAMNSQGPAVFAGDFNSWTPEHISEVKRVCHEFGFEFFNSVPYDSKKTFDMVFIRDLKCSDFKTGRGLSDHPWMSFECEKL